MGGSGEMRLLAWGEDEVRISIGDPIMATMRGAVLAFAAMLLLAGAVRAADDELRAKALKLNDITGDKATKAKIQELLKDADGTKKLLEVAAKASKEKEQPFNVNATGILARVAGALEQYDISERFFRLNLNQALKLQSAEKVGNAYNGLSTVLYLNKQFEECRKVCQEFVEYSIEDKQFNTDLAPYKVPAVHRWIESLVRLKEVDEAKRLLDRLIKADPDNWSSHEFKARVHRMLEEYEAAIKAYDKTLDLVAKDDDLKDEEKKAVKAEIRYTLTGLYVETDQVDKAIDTLEDLVKEDPTNPSYNNDLGYILADHDKKLDEAEKMIRKALEEDRKARKKENPDLKPEDDKDNASYVDSLGWVLFKKKKYKEAKVELEKALADKEGKHIEIYDHLGETCWALGEKKEAVDAWKKGIEAAGPSKREQAKKKELEKKINQKEKEKE
jgi:tetratricopeptide (TPR) repeat protein